MDDSRFEWDAGNADHIWDRHRISVDEAEEAFEDLRRFTYTSDAASERRLAVVGRTTEGRLIAVVVTARPPKVRVVTAREANTWETQQYRKRRYKGQK